MTITIVATTAQLIAALNGAMTGDVIELAPGTYSNVAISGEQFNSRAGVGASQVYIRSEFSNNPAVLTDLSVENSKGLSFQDLHFSTAGAAVGPFGAGVTRPFTIDQSNNISLWDVNVDGSPTGTLADTVSGIIIRSSSFVSVVDSNFEYLHEAITQLNNNNIKIVGNNFSHIYDDGVDGGGTSNIAISGNTFTDFHSDPSDPEHPDCIQFWTTGVTTKSSNITINSNIYVRGTGGAVQGIFINDETGDLPYSKVVIDFNNLTGTLYNGIRVYNVNGGTVFDNILSSYTDYNSAVDILGSTRITVKNNSAETYSYAGSTNLAIADNIVTPPIGDPPTRTITAVFSADAFAISAPEPRSWSFLVLGTAFLGLCLRSARRRSTMDNASSRDPGQRQGHSLPRTRLPDPPRTPARDVGSTGWIATGMDL